MISGIRNHLTTYRPTPSTHAGLWLDRFLRQFKDPDARNEHLVALNDLCVPDGYRAHVERWRRDLAACGDVRLANATVLGRMIVGLGAESIAEVAICLHRSYGVPVIPGSALKGLAAQHAAHAYGDPAWQRGGASHQALFGAVEEAGCVIFHDALWLPGPQTRLPLDRDVMTVHHANYYGGAPPEAPADHDAPNPVAFVTASGTYLLAVQGPPAWTDAALVILQRALRHDGIGAKTAAGYGRLDLDYTPESERAAQAARQAGTKAAEEQRRRDNLLTGLAPGTVAQVLPQVLAMPAGPERTATARACADKLTRKWLKNNKDRNPLVAQLLAILAGDPTS